MSASAFGPAALSIQKQLEDPLDYLRCSTVLKYGKGQLIYNQDQPSTNLFLVVSGRVKVSRLTDNGRQVVVDIYHADEFFGESAFLRQPNWSENVTALEDTQLMTWSVTEIEDCMTKRPRLGIALLQMLVVRTTEFKERIESFAVDDIPTRLSRTLIRLSERGKHQSDGTVTMLPLTHELLGQFVGTSREIITHYMNKLRTQGRLQYCRKSITVKQESMREALKQSA